MAASLLTDMVCIFRNCHCDRQRSLCCERRGKKLTTYFPRNPKVVIVAAVRSWELKLSCNRNKLEAVIQFCLYFTCILSLKHN